MQFGKKKYQVEHSLEVLSADSDAVMNTGFSKHDSFIIIQPQKRDSGRFTCLLPIHLHNLTTACLHVQPNAYNVYMYSTAQKYVTYCGSYRSWMNLYG